MSLPEQSYTLRGDELALVERALKDLALVSPPGDARLATDLLAAISAERIEATAEVHRGGG